MLEEGQGDPGSIAGAFEEQKAERVIPSRKVPRQPVGASLMLWAYGVGFFSCSFFNDRAVMPDDKRFWEGGLAAKQRGESFPSSFQHGEALEEVWELLKVIGETHLPAQQW